MTGLDELIGTYERVVNDTDEERQHAAAREALAEDVEFVGPRMGRVTGRDAMVQALRALRERAPSDDIRIRRTTAVEEHDGWLRFGWEFVDGDGQVLQHGTDVAQVGPDGRLARIIAFFGDLERLGE